MPPKSDLRRYLDQAGELPDDVILGRIVLFTIADLRVRRDDLVKWFEELDLNPAKLPPEIKPVDAYKKATSEAKQEYALPDGNTVTYLCRDVSSTPTYIHRQITREVRDPNRRRLQYDKAIESVFYRPKTGADGRVVNGSERLRLTIDAPKGLTAEEQEKIKEITADVESRYLRYRDYLDGQKVRGVIRDYVKYLNAIELKGGVYFVHQNRTDELIRLQTLVSRLTGCWMNLLPLVDLASEREMVIEAFQREAQEALNEVVKECAHLRFTRKSVSPEAYAKVRQKFDHVMNQASEYLRSLEINQDITGAAAELALESLIDLQKQMLEGNAA
jgi:hypothetical protein